MNVEVGSLSERWRSWVVVAALTLIVGISASAQAEITGSSRIDASMKPIPCTLVDVIDLDTPCERTILTFDIESIISVSLVSDDMRLTTDLAAGIAGLEHGLFSWDATMGELELSAKLWFATPYESVTDVNGLPNTVIIPPGDLRFVTFRLATEFSQGGLFFRNLAMVDDVTFPSPSADYGTSDCDGDGADEGTCVRGEETNPANQYQTSSFAFGDIITLFGQTPSGVLVNAEVGICADTSSVRVKKASDGNSVNPECATDPKPDLLFDYTRFSVSGIPIGPEITGRSSVNCRQVSECALTSSFNVSGGPIPLSTNFRIEDLFSLRFSNSFSVRAETGPATVTIGFSNFEYSSIRLNFRQAFTFGTFSANLSGSTGIRRGTGITGANISLSVSSGTFNAGHSLSLIRDPDEDGLRFGSLNVNMGVNLDPGSVSIRAAFGRTGLSEAVVSIGMQF